jgi:hypothetical protein
VGSQSGTYWGAVAQVVRCRCCWWRQGTPAAALLVAVAAGAVCSGPAPGLRLAPRVALWVAPPRVARPMHCTTFPALAPHSLPAPVGASARPATYYVIYHEDLVVQGYV